MDDIEALGADWPDPRFRPHRFIGLPEAKGLLLRAIAAGNGDPLPRDLALWLRFGQRDVKDAVLVDAILREAEHLAPQFSRDRSACRLRIDVGTLDLVRVAALEELIEGLVRLFRCALGEQRELELALTAQGSAWAIDELVRLGIGRLNLHAASTEAAIDWLRASQGRIRSRELSLSELPASGLADVLACRPERIHLPLTPAATRAPQLLLDAGYLALAPGHYALPNDPCLRARAKNALHYDLLGFCTQANADVLGLGPAAHGQIGDLLLRNLRQTSAYLAALDHGELPLAGASGLDPAQRIAGSCIGQLLCRGEIDLGRLPSWTEELGEPLLEALEQRLRGLINAQQLLPNAGILRPINNQQALLGTIAACLPETA